jgi:outer membrane biogenesis lipoprotein LolB
MAAARTAGTSLSVVLQDLEDWQVKYIEYATQELDRKVLLGIIKEVHNA